MILLKGIYGTTGHINMDIMFSRSTKAMRLLIIEDDTALCDALRLHMTKEGYAVDICQDGLDAEYYLKDGSYSLILLDRMLPGMDGLTLLKKLRSMGCTTPVLMLTAMDAIHDRTDGLDAGADDYLVKPFAMPELLSRIRALLRRPAAMREPAVLDFCDLSLNVREHRLIRADKQVSLSMKETSLLELFFENPDKVLSRATILARVWGGDDAVEDGNVDNYVYFARRRFKALEANVSIKSVHGVGYTMIKGRANG